MKERLEAKVRLEEKLGVKKQSEEMDIQLQHQLLQAEFYLKNTIEKLAHNESKIGNIENNEEMQNQILGKLESKLNQLQSIESEYSEEKNRDAKFLEIQEELFKKEEELKEVILHLGKKVKENAMLQELLEQQKESIIHEQKENQEKSEQIARLKSEVEKISQRELLLQKQLASLQIS